MTEIPLVKLYGANRRVWFLSEDGETITAIKDLQKVYKFGGGSEKDSPEEPIDTETVVLNLKTDTIYDISDKAESITLLASDDFKYCTIHMVTGDEAPTFSMPEEWRATGNDCSGLRFSPGENAEYSIAVDTVGSLTTLYILKIE